MKSKLCRKKVMYFLSLLCCLYVCCTSKNSNAFNPSSEKTSEINDISFRDQIKQFSNKMDKLEQEDSSICHLTNIIEARLIPTINYYSVKFSLAPSKIWRHEICEIASRSIMASTYTVIDFFNLQELKFAAVVLGTLPKSPVEIVRPWAEQGATHIAFSEINRYQDVCKTWAIFPLIKKDDGSFTNAWNNKPYPPVNNGSKN